MIFFIRFFVFISGLSVGSFLNCIICRLEKEESIKGRSYCPKCGHILSFLDLFPLLSFLFLKGKCRYCKKKISFQYPLVEIITGIVFLLIFNYQLSFSSDLWSFGFIFNFLSLVIISSFLIIVFIYDFKHFLIPDFAVYSLVAVASVYSFLNGNFINGLFSATACFLFFLAVFLITRGKGMGFGDVKLSFFIGFFLGYPNFLISLFASFLIGAIIGVGLIAIKKKNLKSEVPFGPFLIIGTVIAFLFGEVIADYYISLLL